MRLFIITVLALLLLPLALAETEGNLNVSVEKVEQSTALSTIILMVVSGLVLLFVIILLVRYILTDQKKDKAFAEKVQRHDANEAEFILDNPQPVLRDDIDKYLKEDERQVVNILRQRDGICSQATLRVVGNFSKATLSRILSELEQRNIVRKEQRGRKNLVLLR